MLLNRFYKLFYCNNQQQYRHHQLLAIILLLWCGANSSIIASNLQYNDHNSNLFGVSLLNTTNFLSIDSLSQQFDFLVINDISTIGNKRTKEHIIFRELDFNVGDTLFFSNIEQVFEENRNQVYNTRLFNDVSVQITANKAEKVSIVIAVEERWYIIPAIIFELTDRNFNEWWVTFNRDLSRTEYGFAFTHQNFRGRMEKLKLNVLFGYTKKFELSYKVPYIDKQRKMGINPYVSYIINREILYKTEANRRVQYRDPDRYIRKRFRVGTAVQRRPSIHSLHLFNFTYFNNTIADTVAVLNPDYFLDGRTQQQYLQLSYTFLNDYRDIAAYPLRGHFFRFFIEKAGIGIWDDVNLLKIEASHTQYMDLGKRFFAVANARGKLSYPDRQPYFNQEGLGFGSNTVKGYDFYIVDGQSFIILRSSLKYQLFDTKFTLLKKVPQLRTIPVAAYLKTYGETAYVRDGYYFERFFNPLNNKWLTGTGVGIDLVTAYDNVFSVEYTYNVYDRQWGFFVNFAINYD